VKSFIFLNQEERRSYAISAQNGALIAVKEVTLAKDKSFELKIMYSKTASKPYLLVRIMEPHEYPYPIQNLNFTLYLPVKVNKIIGITKIPLDQAEFDKYAAEHPAKLSV